MSEGPPVNPAVSPPVPPVSALVSPAEGNCAICYEAFTEQPCHALEECGHRFHTGCAIRWFRSNGSCPLCRGEQATHIGYLDTMCRYKLLRQKSRARNAPRKLKAFVKRICRVEATVKANKKQLRDMKKRKIVEVDGSLTVQQMLSQMRRAKTAIYSAQRRLSLLKRTLGLSDFATPGFRLPNVVSGEGRMRFHRSRRVRL